MPDLESLRNELNQLAKKQQHTKSSFQNKVFDEFMPTAPKVLELTKKYPSPFYVFDNDEINKSIKLFKNSFEKYIKNFHIYYAMKSNPYDGVVKAMVDNNIGIDVSSQRELEIAIRNGAKNMIYTGPGKTSEDLEMALTHNALIDIDSFGELRKLGEISNKLDKEVKVGIRVFNPHNGEWSKFGIAMDRFEEFLKASEKYPKIKIVGIQNHQSWNENAEPYVTNIKAIADILAKIEKKFLDNIEFIDIGGGFLFTDIYHEHNLTYGKLNIILDELVGKDEYTGNNLEQTSPASLEEYAQPIGKAVEEYLYPILPNVKIFTEPGRILCYKAMHIVLKVVDIKDTKSVIVDGGVNITGDNTYPYKYFPIINITHPSKEEKPLTVYGSLCAPYDLFGYHCFMDKVEEGDILVMPYQGSYTYTAAQNFIKEIPEVYHI